jgi:hypothetical protein
LAALPSASVRFDVEEEGDIGDAVFVDCGALGPIEEWRAEREPLLQPKLGRSGGYIDHIGLCLGRRGRRSHGRLAVRVRGGLVHDVKRKSPEIGALA